MKKIMITTVLLLMMLSMTVSAYSSRSYSPDRCCAAGCNGRKYNKSSYCSEHKCVIYDCKNKRGSDGMYCTTHHNQYWDEFDDYEDAYDAFLDDEDAWDDY